MKTYTLTACIILFPFCLISQSYNTAGGIRMGTDWGFTFKQRIAKKTTIEAILQSSLQREEVLLTGMVEQHYPIIGRRINVYYGGGFHKGWINSTAGEAGVPEDPFGMTMIGGVEISLGRLNASYDFKPAINIIGGENKFYTQSGVSFRYILVKRTNLQKKRRRNKRKRARQKSKKMNNFNWKFWKKKK